MQYKKLNRSIRKHLNSWSVISLIGAAIILLPILTIMSSLLQQPNENWEHIKQYLLMDYALQSLWLVVFIGFFTCAIGVILAWLIAAYDFPLKRFFRWALVLPLAIPPYIAGYTYAHMFSYTGSVQKAFRAWGIQVNPKYLDVMSFEGIIIIFTLFLFPYVYMITRVFLENQSASYIENARLLGRSPTSIFFRIALPLSRPALVGGVMLVIFEVLSDYGLTSYFGVYTISTAIFQTWFGMYDVDSAMRLAAWLLVGIIGLFLLERLMRRGQRYSTVSDKVKPLVPIRLTGIKALTAMLFCVVIFSLSFLIPVLQLIVWASWTYQDVFTSSFVRISMNTISIALAATLIIMLLTLIIANVSRIQGFFGLIIAKIATSGYSIPGTIVAIGVLAVFIMLDRLFIPLYQALGLGEAPLVLSMSIAMLLTAYVIRFMATGYNAVESGFEKIGMKYMEASHLLGHGLTTTFLRVELPLIKGAVFSGFILTFVEIIKELPLTLLLRPFNFDTLATKTYQYASDEQVFQAAVPALFIIAISMISVYIVHQFERSSSR